MMIRINGMRSTRVRNMLALVVSLAVQSAFAETPGKVEAPRGRISSPTPKPNWSTTPTAWPMRWSMPTA